MLSEMTFLMLMAVAELSAGAVATVSGFGIGSLLTPLLSLWVGTKLPTSSRRSLSVKIHYRTCVSALP